MVSKAKQLSVPCEDRPGTLAHLAKLLGDSKVNIVAMNCATYGAQGAVQIIVDDVNKAKKTLDAARLPYTEQNVLRVELPNSPGCLGEFAGKLATRDINISSGYATAVEGSRKASIVLEVSDLERAARIR